MSCALMWKNMVSTAAAKFCEWLFLLPRDDWRRGHQSCFSGPTTNQPIHIVVQEIYLFLSNFLQFWCMCHAAIWHIHSPTRTIKHSQSHPHTPTHTHTQTPRVSQNSWLLGFPVFESQNIDHHPENTSDFLGFQYLIPEKSRKMCKK